MSIVICCHNSGKRLPETLRHLMLQKTGPDLQWEIIVIDNASTDDTCQVAEKFVPLMKSVRLRIVSEQRLGLSNAREKGLQESRYSFVSFIDDDNWVCTRWVQIVFEVMSSHCDVAACGGMNEAVTETIPPPWFDRFKHSYAVGNPADSPGDITWAAGYVYGAGLTVRKSAWRALVENNYSSLLSDRTGNSLNSGGDSEFCFALRLAGWRIWYEPRLTLKHYLPKERLNWAYMRRLHRGFGAATVHHDPYRFALSPPKTLRERLRQAWYGQIIKIIIENYKRFFSCALGICWREGDAELLYYEWYLGRLTELLRITHDYDTMIKKLRTAPWVKLPCSEAT